MMRPLALSNAVSQFWRERETSEMRENISSKNFAAFVCFASFAFSLQLLCL